MSLRPATYRALFAGLLGLACVGCIPALPLRHLSIEEEPRGVRATLGGVIPISPEEAARRATLDGVILVGAVEETGSLDELLEIGVRHHPDLRAARARVEAARGRMIQAGLYPNPAIGPNFGQLGERANPMGEAGARFTQTIVTNHKLALARAAGARGAEAADWQAVTKWHDVVARVRFAYFELLTALREQDTTREIVRASTEAMESANALQRLRSDV